MLTLYLDVFFFLLRAKYKNKIGWQVIRERVTSISTGSPLPNKDSAIREPSTRMGPGCDN